MSDHQKISLINIDRLQRGASLIEIMISVFIFAVGVLGFASLQSRSLQATFDNGQRDQIVWLSQSLIDRIRMNADGADEYVTRLDGFESSPTGFGFSECAATETAVGTNECDSATCTSTQMAVYDIWDVFCSNDFQGANAIRNLSSVLTCTDADTDSSCDDNADMQLVTTWCSRSVETTEELGTTSTNSCDNTVAQMSYQINFRP